MADGSNTKSHTAPGNTPFIQHVSTAVLMNNTTNNAIILFTVFITFTGTYNSYETLNLTGFC